jgi:glycogen synthase
MRILVYSHFFYPNIGGVETASCCLATNLSKQGQDVTLVTRIKDENKSKDFNFKVIRNPNFISLSKLVKEADIIHMQGYNIFIFLLSKLFNKQLIWDHHGYDTICLKAEAWNKKECNYKPFQCLKCLKIDHDYFKITILFILYYFKRFSKNEITYHISHSTYVKNRLKLKNNVVIPNCLDFSYLSCSVKNQFDILFVGRLIREKGCDTLVKAAAICKSKGIDLSILICGNGYFRTDIENLIKVHQLENNVKLIGFVSEEQLSKLYSECKIVVVPSLWPEAFGMVALEAMIHKKPVIASNYGGLSEIVKNSGFLFEPGNEIDLAEKIQNLLGNEKLAGILGKKGFEKIKTNYGCDKIIHQYISLYKKLVQDY